MPLFKSIGGHSISEMSIIRHASNPLAATARGECRCSNPLAATAARSACPGGYKKAVFRQQWAHIRESMQPAEAYYEVMRNAAVQCRCLGPSTLGGIFRVSSGYLPGIFWATKKGPACGFVFMNLFKDLEQKLDEDKTYLSTWVLQR